MNTVTLKIEGMHCDGCASIVQSLLERQPGTKKATASFKEAEARVLYDPQAVNEEQLAAVVERGGYRVTGRTHD
jgi:copper chaperone CopZ